VVAKKGMEGRVLVGGVGGLWLWANGVGVGGGSGQKAVICTVLMAKRCLLHERKEYFF